MRRISQGFVSGFNLCIVRDAVSIFLIGTFPPAAPFIHFSGFWDRSNRTQVYYRYVSGVCNRPTAVIEPLCTEEMQGSCGSTVLEMQDQKPQDKDNFKSSHGGSFALEDFLIRSKGKHSISRVLVANNGMAAVKAIRSIRKWAYETLGDETAIKFFSMCTPEDILVNAESVRLADHCIEVPGGSANNNYSNVDLIVDIAERENVDAVWVGWGFASENPVLAEKLMSRTPPIIFIGPPPHAVRALGDKIASTIVAQAAGVPCIAWNGSNISDICYDDQMRAYVSSDVYDHATVKSSEMAMEEAEKIGYPVIIKASEGGGGRGIRIVESGSGIRDSYEQVIREVPGSPVFVMKVLRNARHLEVQLLADIHGNAITLFGRDCSVQRRHQKVIEEAPITVAPSNIVEKMEKYALKLAKLVGYQSAGTVEYLYDPVKNQFYFLELNPRLQVEHPTTEMVSGVNIPAAQLQIAMGIPLNCIKDIRIFYGMNPYETGPIDFEFTSAVSLKDQRKPSPKGHVIAARINAENPEAGFRPNGGKVLELNFRSNTNVWGYFSVNSAGGVHEYADSQFGHVFSYGESRDVARRELVMALKELLIRGEFRTTVDYIIQLLETERFVENSVHTGWLDALISDKTKQEMNDADETLNNKRNSQQQHTTSNITMVTKVLAGISALAYRHFEKLGNDFVSSLAKGQVPQVHLFNNSKLFDLVYQGQLFSVKAIFSGQDIIDMVLNGTHIETSVRILSDGGYMVLLRGLKSLVYCIKEGPTANQLTIDGKPYDFEKDIDPSVLRSPSPGKLTRFHINDGDKLKKGDPYAEMEVMKIVTTLYCRENGIIKLVAQEGSMLKTGDITATLILDNPTKVRKIKKFSDPLPDFGPPTAISTKPNDVYNYNLKMIYNIMDGYDIQMPTKRAFQLFLKGLNDHLAVVHEAKKIISSLNGRIPTGLELAIRKILDEAIDNPDIKSMADKCKEAISAYTSDNLPGNKGSKSHSDSQKSDLSLSTARLQHAIILQTLQPLSALLNLYKNGLKDREIIVLSTLLSNYYHTEQFFNNQSYDKAIKDLREVYKTNLKQVVKVVRSHLGSSARTELVLEIFAYLRSKEDKDTVKVAVPVIAHIANMVGSPGNIHVVIRARELLSYCNLPLFAERASKTRSVLMNSISPLPAHLNAVTELDRASVSGESTLSAVCCDPEGFLPLINSTEFTTVTLADLFFIEDPVLKVAAYYAYTLRIYRNYTIMNVELSICSSENSDSTCAIPLFKCDFTSKSIMRRNAPKIAISFSRDNPHSNVRCKSITDYPLKSPNSGESYCALCVFNSLKHADTCLVKLVKSIDADNYTTEDGSSDRTVSENSLYVVVKDSEDELSNDDIAQTKLSHLLQPAIELLREKRLKNVTFTVVQDMKVPRYFTFRESLDFQEDVVIRNMKPTLAYMLEPHRMSNYYVKSHFLCNTLVYVYHAVAKNNPSDTRLFARKVVNPTPNLSRGQDSNSLLEIEVMLALTDLIDALEMIETSYHNTDCNHIFAHFSYSFQASESAAESRLRWCVESFAPRLLKLRITAVEIKISLFSGNGVDIMPSTAQYPSPSSYGDSSTPPRQCLSPKRNRHLPPALPEAFAELSPFSDKIIDQNPDVNAMFMDHHASNVTYFRFVFSCFTGYVTKIEKFRETPFLRGYYPVAQKLTSDVTTESSHTVCASYPTKESVQQKRNKAHLLGTTYIYDFPELFKRALEQVWENYTREVGVSPPPTPVKCVELALNEKKTSLIKTDRSIGQNSCGMVAWEMELFTPEYKDGRSIIVIANDVTTNIGSFGPEEDEVYYNASKLARERGIPRIYISANSGARIGLADEVIPYLKVKWKDPSNMKKGFDYLYLAEEGYNALIKQQAHYPGKVIPVQQMSQGTIPPTAQPPAVPLVNCERIVEPDGTSIYKLTDVIGKSDGLGVENLKGSAKIASETSLAYNEIFTLTLVTCRSVGIGAYLARLGQRVIQVEYAPIILTGAGALNKILGRTVYASNLQLGGTQIMHTNGVSHLIAKSDMEGVSMVIHWLSFVPKSTTSPLPILRSVDPIDRRVETRISSDGTYDPRRILTGYMEDESIEQSSTSDNLNEIIDANDLYLKSEFCGLNRLYNNTNLRFLSNEKRHHKQSKFIHGFFDRGSFVEYLSGWAGGVIVARARLGGIPVGVISVETRPTESVIWADPADELSTEQRISEAAQVWYPDSAKKTAQSINDFNNGERLPLFIFASWRGFSGGQSDMRREVLKYGANIVDGLRCYNQPVFVYIIGELRGGAWVVVDPSINPSMMEMYAEPNSRGGVLEPEGIIEIKFRRPRILSLMERFSPDYRELKRRLSDDTIPPDARQNLKAEIEKLEEELMPVFHNVALEFADLHDRPGRMLGKNAISGVVHWHLSRRFFMWRLLRRIIEDRLINSICNSCPDISRKEAKDLLTSWYMKDTDDMGKFVSTSTGNSSEAATNVQENAQANKINDDQLLQWLTLKADNIQLRIDMLRREETRRRIMTLHSDSPKEFISSLKVMCAKNQEFRRELSSILNCHDDAPS